MPKLTPKQQQKKLRRHNPIARRNTASTGGSISAAAASDLSATSPEQQDVIPLINALPLSTSSATSLEDDEKIHRALLCLNPLLLTKTSRVALLTPKHLLLQRLLHHLDHHRLEVRKEAAGCLRNLCVEGQWSGREQVYKLGGGGKALAQIEYAAKELQLLPKTDRDLTAIHAGPQSSETFGSRKPEEMNRKERRNAAKASKSSGGAAVPSDIATPVAATPASAAAEVDAHDLQLLHLSLLENHLTIIWCLLETVDSPVWLDQLNKSTLGELLCSVIARGADTYGERVTPANKVTKKEQEEIRAAELDAALTSVNVLAAWVEDNPSASACLVGLPVELAEQVVAFEQGGNSSAPGSKSRKRLETILDKFGTLSDKQAREGSIRLSQLASAASLMNSLQMQSPEDVQRLNLGLLALASCTNILTSLPVALRAWIPSPRSATSSPKTLLQWLVSDATPLLLQFLVANGTSSTLWTAAFAAASISQRELSDKRQQQLQLDTGMEVDVRRETDENEPQEDEGEDAPSSSLTSRKVDTMTLAMELLGEICAEAASEIASLLPGTSSDAADGSGDMEEDDDIYDREASEDTLDSEQEEEMLMLTEVDHGPDDDGDLSMDVSASKTANGAGAEPLKAKNNGSSINGSTKRKWDTPYSSLFAQQNVPSSILRILSAYSEVSSSSGSVSSPSSREFVLASHSTLANLLSAIASFAQPPPTHPLEAGSRKERDVRLFQKWVIEHASALGATWEEMVAWSGKVWSALDGRVNTSEEDRLWAAMLSRPVWTCLNALVVMHEGLETLPISLPTGASVHSGLECVFGEPLKALLSYRGPDAGSTSAAHAASLIISTLSYLGRVPSLANRAEPQPTLLERNRFASDRFLSLLSTYTSPKSESSTSTTTEILPLVAVLNALIDLYADETSAWDVAIFRERDMLGTLQSLTRAEAGGRLIRERIRRVDKRREEALRSMAEEAWDNWASWIAYRQGLEFST